MPLNPEFVAQARALFPNMPTWVVNDFARGLARYDGDPELAWSIVRSDDRYDTTFAGNRRDDGSFRMTESEYMATKDAYSQVLSDYGLNPDVFSSQFTTLIGGDVSVNEFAARLDAVHQGVINNSAAVQATFQQWYGAAYNPSLYDSNPSVAMAMALDPNVGTQLLNQQITFAQIGGAAAQHGFSRTAAEAAELAGRGVNQQSANQIYSTAAAQLPTLTTLSERFNDEDLFELDEFEDAALGDAEQQQRAERLRNAEMASFSSGRVAQDQSGGLSGLRQR